MSYFRLLWNLKDYKIMVGLDVPYTSRDFLRVEPIFDHVDENKLRYVLDDEFDLPVPHFLSFATRGVLVCKPEIWNLFSELIVPDVLIFEGLCENERIVFVSIQHEEFCFDFDKSIFVQFEDSDDIYQIDRLKLIEGCESQFDIFRLGDNWGCRMELIVSQKFKDVYFRNELTGLVFEKV